MRNSHLLGVSAAVAAFAGLASAQSGLSSAAAPQPIDAAFPLTSTDVQIAPGVRVFEPRTIEIEALSRANAVLMRALPTAEGGPVDVLIERVPLERMEFGFQVDGVPVPGLIDGLDLSVWMGEVVGQPGSEVVLSFSNRGVRGWLADGSELTHLLAEPDEKGDWARSRTLVVGDAQLRALGVENEFRCGTGDVARDATPGAAVPTAKSSFSGSATILRECSVAIETDYQLNQVFNGDLTAEAAHITSLLAAGSQRYIEQIGTALTYPYVQFYTTPDDPWSTPDNGGGSLDMLDEFVGAWQGNVPAGATLGHMLSGAGLGGGVAYLEGICDTSQNISFAVSGNLDGQTPFPITVGPFNWEFIVFTHETGHNFGSPHTHDYSPQIDNCAGGGCISDGTVMSYCHLCPGGMNNMTTFFHPTVVNLMTGRAEECLPLFLGVEVASAGLVAPNAPIAVTADVTGNPTNGVDLSYRYDAQSAFTTVAMTSVGNGTYGADIPGAPCGATPEYFVTFDEPDFGTVTSETVEVEIGIETVVFADDFESANGWTVGAPGDSATTGIWERVDPQQTGAQPGNDVTESGTLAFVTDGTAGSGLGSFDIDGGATTLTSPSIDLSGGDARIGYWRWYSNDAGANPGIETFEIDISNDGGSSWTPVEVVGPGGPDASGGWRFFEFNVSDVIAPTGNVRMRFVASDDVGAVVEAALDEFRVRRVECTTCQEDLGFGGPGDLALELCGDVLVPGGSAALTVSNATANETAFILVGTQNMPIGFAGGTIVPNPQILIEALPTDANGTGSLPINGGAQVPTTLYLQAVAIDLSLPAQLEFSNAIAAEFLP